MLKAYFNQLHPDFNPSRIPDLGTRIPDFTTATKEKEKNCYSTFFVATNITKL
jgi:hypothetical protein